jgi:IS4 transposase
MLLGALLAEVVGCVFAEGGVLGSQSADLLGGGVEASAERLGGGALGGGRAIKVLTTLLDPDAFPAREIAALYTERWQIEIAYLHLKKTIKGTGRVLRGRSVTLVRQEAWRCCPSIT